MLAYWSSNQSHSLMPNTDGIGASIAGFGFSESRGIERDYQPLSTTDVVFGRACVDLGSGYLATPDNQKLFNIQSRCRKRTP